jgi:hypothetical protein
MLTLEPGDHVTLDVPLTALAPASPTSNKATLLASAAPDKSLNQTSDDSLKPWAWAAVGTGTAGLLLSAVTGIIALEKKSALDSECHPGCPVSAADELSTFRTTRTVSYASLLAGSASLGLGGYILLTGNGERKVVGASLSPASIRFWGVF